MRNAGDAASMDLTRHKWAGLQVALTLEATDAADKVGRSETVMMVLPEKLFLEPLARASQEVRLDVLRETAAFEPTPDNMAERLYDKAGYGDRMERAPAGVQKAALKLDALTYKPEFFYNDLTIYFGFRRAHEILRFARDTADTDPVDDLLWSVALRAEYGTVADAQRRLNAARRALEKALRDGASEEEIQRLMEAFRNAAEDYIAAKMAEAMMNGGEAGGEQGGAPPNDMLGSTDLADMLEALQDLTETGATDAARQLLSDVTNLLNNLEFQSGGASSDGFGGQQNGENGEDSDAPPEEQKLQRALDKLAELLEEQRRLNDETLQERFGSDDGSRQDGGQQQGGQQPNGQQNGQQPGQNMPGNQGQSGMGQDPNGQNRGGTGAGDMGDMLADRQSQLLDRLGEYLNEGGEEGVGGSVSEEQLDEAERALQNAENALRRGDLGSAQFFQDQAIQNMREAFGQMSENLDDLREARRGTGENAASDPLGRSNTSGAQQNDGDGVKVPDQADRQRARDILDALRDRLNQSTDPEEREYLQRLLDRF